MDFLGKLSAIDIGVIVLYVVFFVCLCVHSNKKMKAKDFTNAGQSLSWFMVAGSTIATTMGGNMVIGKYDMILEAGMAGITSSLFWWVGWIFLLIMAVPLRKSGVSSLPMFLEKRYNGAAKKVSSYCVLISVIASCAATFLAIGVIFEALGLCNRRVGTLIGAVIVILLTLPSGLYGVALTDTIQTIIILVTFGIIFPVLVFRTAGGFETVIASQTPERLSLVKGIAPITMVGWAVSYSLSTGAEPNFAQRIFAARSTKEAVAGSVTAWVVSLVVAGIVTALPALAMTNIFPDITMGSTFTVRFVVTYFPVALKGLILSVLLGLALTSGDSYLLLLGSTFVDDIVRPKQKGYTDKKTLLVTRMTCVVFALLLCLMALYVDKIYALFKIGASAYGAGIFFPLILGCFWKKANAKAAAVAMLTGSLFSFGFDMFIKVPLGLNIDGVIIGALLNLMIMVGGSILLNNQSMKVVKR